MKVVIILILCVLSVYAAKPKYTEKYDSIDVDQILRSDRLVRNYANCFLNKGHCTPDGSEIKANLPDALLTDCLKCSEKQKDTAKKLLRFLIDKKPTIYKDLEKKYDPTGEYKRKYREEAKKEGIVLL